MSPYKKIFLYSVLVLTAAGVLHTVLSAQTKAGSQVLNQGKVVFTYKSFPADTLKTNTVTFTVLGVPCYLSVSPEPRYLFGRSGEDSAKVTITVEDTLHTILLTATNTIECSTDLGTFSNGRNTITLGVVNGKAETYLHTVTIENDKQTATVTASTSKLSGERIQASAPVIIYPGAVTGVVRNGTQRTPLKGAIALVTDQSAVLVGADTTNETGEFFIPLNKRVTMYHLQIVVVDAEGDTVQSATDIDGTTFPRPAAVIPNVIAGRIQYQVNGIPIPAPDVTVYLDSIPRLSTLPRKGTKASSIASTHVQVRVTDEKGRFKFENLPPALYQITVDTSVFRNMKDPQVFADTVAGTFTINVNIDVALDSLIDLRMDAKENASAGDTLRYSIVQHNPGNVVRYNAALIDTLPAPVKFISMEKGTFASAVYDSVKRIMRWTIDTVKIKGSDSASVTVALTRNIPDSTVVRNTVWFSAPGEIIKFSKTAATTIRSQAIPRFTSYFSGRDSIAAGDSVVKIYAFNNAGTDSLRGITIVDTLFHAGKSSLSNQKKTAPAGVLFKDSVIVISVGAIAPGRSDTVGITIATDPGLAPGSRIRSIARFMRNGVPVDSIASELSIMNKKTWASLLKVMKTANKKSAEIGDVVTYQVTVTNAYAGPLHAIGVYDLVPHAFAYVKNSARLNGRPLEPALDPSVGSLTWAADTIGIRGTLSLVYQLALGADALESEGMNTASASGETGDGIRLVSDPSQWQVTVRPGVFTEKGLIIGKVFYDDSRNMFQEEGENGIKDVELWMEDGTRITTGDDGKYSVPEMKPGQHVLRVNERTLPAGTELMGGSNDFARDPVSRFVRVTSSGIAKANFFVKRDMRDTIARTAVRSLRSAALRQALPKYVFKGGEGKPAADTIEMIVSFTYRGDKFLQRIAMNELLPPEFRYVENSARFNERPMTPAVKGDSLLWALGRGSSSFTGTLRYRAALNGGSKPMSSLHTYSVVTLMTSDSVVMTSAPLVTENVVKETAQNEIASSSEITTFMHPASVPQRTDTVSVVTGDEVTFSTVIRLNAHKQPRSVVLIDSLPLSFAINERSLTLNGVPLQSDRISIGTLKSPGSRERASSVELTDLLRSGKNVVSYIARVSYEGGDTTIRTKSHLSVVDQFGERRTGSSDDVTIIYRHQQSEQRKAEPLIVRSEKTAPKKPETHAARPDSTRRVQKPADVLDDASKKLDVAKNLDAVKNLAVAKNLDAVKNLDATKKLDLAKNVDAAKKLDVAKDMDPAKKAALFQERNRPDWMVYQRAPGTYMVQISSWDSKEKAQVQADRFARAHGCTMLLQEHVKDGKIFFAVQFGPYKTNVEAKAAIEEYGGSGNKGSASDKLATAAERKY